MVERGRQLRLAEEALAEVLVLRELRRDQLQGDVALQTQVVGAVDDPHPTAADQRLDSVAEELGTDQRICSDGPFKASFGVGEDSAATASHALSSASTLNTVLADKPKAGTSRRSGAR